MSDLLPCPFGCAGTINRYDRGSYHENPKPLINCSKCGASQATAERWNTRALLTEAPSRAPVDSVEKREMLHIVCDGPPGPVAGRFVECETPEGRSVRAGEWHERNDGLWELRIPTIAALTDTGEEPSEAILRKCDCGEPIGERWNTRAILTAKEK